MSLLESLLGGIKSTGNAAKDALREPADRELVSTTLDKGAQSVLQTAQKTTEFFKSLVPTGMKVEEVFPSANALGNDDIRGRTAELKAARVATSEEAGKTNSMAPAPGSTKWRDSVRPQRGLETGATASSGAPQP